MYEQYELKKSFHGLGEPVSVLSERFERLTEENFIGDFNAKSSAVNYLREKGWIDIKDANGNRLSGLPAFSYGRMQPTPKGLEYLNKISKHGLPKIAVHAVELCGRLVKGIRRK